MLKVSKMSNTAKREGYLLQYSIWKAFRHGGVAVHHQAASVFGKVGSPEQVD